MSEIIRTERLKFRRWSKGYFIAGTIFLVYGVGAWWLLGALELPEGYDPAVGFKLSSILMFWSYFIIVAMVITIPLLLLAYWVLKKWFEDR